ncbi:MAG TPA: hypothetical protein VLT59_17130 [Steroidobacteraceae bacterium]|nr:hypothetical protein [Steroidobacteraceae bacterium]
MFATAIAIWLVFLVGAFFYTRAARHPSTPLLAAYLLFVSIFTLVAFVIFAAGLWLFEISGAGGVLSNPAGAILFLAIVFVPAFLLARWQLRKPPRQRMPGDPDRVVEPGNPRRSP